MYGQTDAWHALMEKLSTVVTRYLNAQIAAGAQVVQLFDSWVGALSPSDYDTYVAPHVRSIFASLTDAPTIHFGTSTASLLERLTDAGGDIISVDARQLLDEAVAADRLRPRHPGQPRRHAPARRLGAD